MAGGLLQLASVGVEDEYLTTNPEITYFSKVYRRYTNFASEFKTLHFDQSLSFNDTLTITIDKLGDLMGKSFIQVELPNLNISDKIFNNKEYINLKQANIDQLKKDLIENEIVYQNFLNFSNIELEFYIFINEILKTKNLTPIILDGIYKSYLKTINLRDDYILAINSNILDKVNIKKTIEVYLTEIIFDTQILLSKILINVNNIKKFITKIFNKSIKLKKEIQKMERGLIEYCWDEYFGLNLFTSYEIMIDGLTIERYDKDNLFIFLKHHYRDNIQEYLNEMIGKIDRLNQMNNNKQTTIIYIPLIFWFCHESVNYLPLIALRYSDVTIKLKVNKLENLLFFQDIKEKYNKLISLTIEGTDNYKNIINNNKVISIKYNNKFDNYIINVEFITRETLNYLFPTLSSSELDNIMIYSKNGTRIDLFDFGNIRRNLSNKLILFKLFGKEIYYDYNILYSYIKHLNVNLITEFIFLDDVEREKFAINKLEYFIDTFKNNYFNLNDGSIFNSELDFTNPVKYIYLYFIPEGFNFGLHQYDKKLNNNYLIDFNQIEYFNININNLDMFEKNIFKDNYYNFTVAQQYLNNELPRGVYLKNFSIYPEKAQPSGSVNFSFLKGKVIRMKFNQQFLNNYYDVLKNFKQKNLKLNFVVKNYNIFSVNKGKGKIMFN
tara:strand:- start:1114 stop:3111 length:1998 start_codon:yes stop_codon:yes gene_type:complete